MNQRTKNFLIAILVLAVLGTGTLAWNLNRQLQELSQTSTGSDESTALIKRLAALEKLNQALKAEIERLKGNQHAGASNEPPPPPNEMEPAGARNMSTGRPEPLRGLMSDPKFISIVNARERQMLDNRYAKLFKNLVQSGKLTPAQIEEFKNLLVERQNTLRDIRQSAREQGITDRAQIDELARSTQAELDAQIQRTLGDTAYADFQTYEKTYPQQAFTQQLAQSLSYTDAPLSDNQAQQLIQILSNASANTQQQRGFPGPFGTVKITDDVIESAAKILSPTQLSALENIKRQQQAQEAFRNSRSDSANTLQAPPPPGP